MLYLLYCCIYLQLLLQVETVGRVYMAASGAPDRNENHAQNIADVSLQLIENVRSLELPSGLNIRIRIGNTQHTYTVRVV